jgi:hypothetical protein
MYGTLERVCSHLAIEGPSPLHLARNDTHQALPEESGVDEDGICELSPPASPSTAQAPIDTYLETAPMDPAAAGSSPWSVRRKQNESQDLVTKHLISFENAKVLVDRYLSHLDHFLYGICGHFRDIDGIRKASPTLFAAVCTVAAFQDPDKRELFGICNEEYRQLISSSIFKKKDHQHIRALCIGSFWLPDASRILSSDAIRRAADTRLSRNFNRLLVHTLTDVASCPTSQDELHEKRDKVRLWYLLFICDQHLSVLHNRDCLLRPDAALVINIDAFLSSEGSSQQDTRIASQVTLLTLMCQIRDVFGADEMMPVAKTLTVQFSHFARELDSWFARCSGVFGEL